MTDKVSVSFSTIEKLFDGYLYMVQDYGYTHSDYEVSGSRRFNKELREIGLLKKRPSNIKPERHPTYASIAKEKKETKEFFNKYRGKEVIVRGSYDMGLSVFVIFRKMVLSGFPNKTGFPRTTVYLTDEKGKRHEFRINQFYTAVPENYVYSEELGFYIQKTFKHTIETFGGGVDESGTETLNFGL